jgi:hypothetical protein
MKLLLRYSRLNNQNFFNLHLQIVKLQLMAAIHSFCLQKSPSRSLARVSKRKQPGDPQLQVELSEEQVLELQIDREALISVEDIGVEGAENISLVHDLMEEEAQLASPSSQHAELADGVKEIVTDRLLSLSVAEIVRRLLSNILIRQRNLFYCIA